MKITEELAPRNGVSFSSETCTVTAFRGEKGVMKNRSHIKDMAQKQVPGYFIPDSLYSWLHALCRWNDRILETLPFVLDAFAILAIGLPFLMADKTIIILCKT